VFINLGMLQCFFFFVQTTRFQLLEKGRWREGEIERGREKGRKLGWVKYYFN
jgi:hypothetical protein